jgi:hypothetical protein
MGLEGCGQASLQRLGAEAWFEAIAMHRHRSALYPTTRDRVAAH